MDSSTELFPVDLDVLEAVLLNCDKEIPKLRMELEFSSVELLNKFKEKMNVVVDDQNEIVDSEKESDNEQTIPETATIEQILEIDKLETLEEATILKQFYQPKLQEISKKTGTSILVVPSKIKYYGGSPDDIEDAKDMVFQLRRNLNINKIHKYGHEIFESKTFTGILKRENINLAKIADKFYFWYDEGEEDTKVNVIKNTIQKYMHKYHHRMYELYPNFKNHYSSVHLACIVSLKAKIFEQKMVGMLNEEVKEENRVELSKSGRELILHQEVVEQVEIFEKQLTEIYSNFTYFFVIYDQYDQAEDEIKNIEEIEKLLNSKRINWYRKDNVLVIGYEKTLMKSVNETMVEESKLILNRIDEFLQSLQGVLELNLHITIEVFTNNLLGVDVDIDEFEHDKKISIESKKMDCIRAFSLKNRKKDKFLEIIKKYILEPKFNKKKKQSHDQTLNQTNKTSKIFDQSSEMYELNNTQIDKNFNSVIPPGNILDQVNESKQIPFFLSQYSKLIEDVEKDKKYTNVEQLTKGKGEEKYREIMENFTTFKYFVYKVKIPEKCKTELQGNKMVTVFVKDEFKSKLYVSDVNISLLMKGSELKANGWLVNVPKEKITFNADKKLMIPCGHYEVVKYVKYVPD